MHGFVEGNCPARTKQPKRPAGGSLSRSSRIQTAIEPRFGGFGGSPGLWRALLPGISWFTWFANSAYKYPAPPPALSLDVLVGFEVARFRRQL